jgi:DNA-directed RNA polymerase subunit RPC12/RpoP
MSNVFHCAFCESVFPLGSQFPPGKTVKCPMCGALVAVPADDTAPAAKPGKPSEPPAAPKPAPDKPAKKAAPPPEPALGAPTPGARMPSAADILAAYKPKPTAPTSPGTRPKPSPAAPTAQGVTKKPAMPPSAEEGPGKAGSAKPAPPVIKKAAGTHPGTTRRPAVSAPAVAGEEQATIDKDTRHEIDIDKATPEVPQTAPGSATTPGESAKVRVVCPKCSTRLKFPASLPPGSTVKCPRCGERVKTPDAPASVSEPAAAPELAPSKLAPSDTVAARSAPAPEVPAKKPPPVAAFSIESIAQASLPAAAPEKETVWARPEDQAETAARLARQRRQVLLAGGIVLGIGLAVMAYRMIRPDQPTRGATIGPEPIALSDWHAFTPANGNCTVLLPGEPTLIPPDKPLVAVKLPECKQYRLDRPDKSASFLLYFAPLPPSATSQQMFEEFYHKQRDDLIERNSGSIRLETKLSWKGHPGREVQIITAQGQTVIQRMYLVENSNDIRLYVLQATVTGDNGPGMAAKYLDSLQLPPRNDPRRS